MINNSNDLRPMEGTADTVAESQRLFQGRVMEIVLFMVRGWAVWWEIATKAVFWWYQLFLGKEISKFHNNWMSNHRVNSCSLKIFDQYIIRLPSAIELLQITIGRNYTWYTSIVVLTEHKICPEKLHRLITSKAISPIIFIGNYRISKKTLYF